MESRSAMRFRRTGLITSLLLLLSGPCFAQWTTSGSNIYNSNSGNVGIGTTVPGAKLDVNGTFGAQGLATFAAGLKTTLLAGYTAGQLVLSAGNSGSSGNYIEAQLGGWGADLFRVTAGGGSNPTIFEIVPNGGGFFNNYNGSSYTTHTTWSNTGVWTFGQTATMEKGIRIMNPSSGDNDQYDFMFETGNVLNIRLEGTSGNGTVNLVGSGGVVDLSVSGTVKSQEIVVETTGADFVFEDNYKLRALEDVERFISNHGHLPEIPSAEEMRADGMQVGEMQTKLLQKIEELTLYIIAQEKRARKQHQQLARQQLEINELKARL